MLRGKAVTVRLLHRARYLFFFLFLVIASFTFSDIISNVTYTRIFVSIKNILFAIIASLFLFSLYRSVNEISKKKHAKSNKRRGWEIATVLIISCLFVFIVLNGYFAGRFVIIRMMLGNV